MRNHVFLFLGGEVGLRGWTEASFGVFRATLPRQFDTEPASWLLAIGGRFPVQVQEDRVTQSTGGAGRLVAVVVTHNRLEQLQTTLERLLDAPPAHLAGLVVVDNASGDGTAEWLAGLADPRLEVLSSRENLGGAGGFERGMRRAMEAHAPDWLVLMDDDGRPEPGGLAAFHASDLSIWDAAAAAVRYPDGEICDMNRPSRNPFTDLRTFLHTVLRLGGRDGFHITPEDYDSERPFAIDITSFVGFFVSASEVDRVGYPDPALFIYADDGIYTLSLREAGARIGFFPGVRFEHDCRSIGADRRFRPLWKVYYYHRNLFFLYRRAAGWMIWPLMLMILPRWLMKVRHYPGARGAYLKLLARAVSDGLRGRRAVSLTQISGE